MKYSEPRKSRLCKASSSGRCQSCGGVTWGSSARARSEKGCQCTPAFTSTASVSALYDHTDGGEHSSTAAPFCVSTPGPTDSVNIYMAQYALSFRAAWLCCMKTLEDLEE